MEYWTEENVEIRTNVKDVGGQNGKNKAASRNKGRGKKKYALGVTFPNT